MGLTLKARCLPFAHQLLHGRGHQRGLPPAAHAQQAPRPGRWATTVTPLQGRALMTLAAKHRHTAAAACAAAVGGGRRGEGCCQRGWRWRGRGCTGAAAGNGCSLGWGPCAERRAEVRLRHRHGSISLGKPRDRQPRGLRGCGGQTANAWASSCRRAEGRLDALPTRAHFVIHDYWEGMACHSQPASRP